MKTSQPQKIVILIQARFSSKRLPGKVLHPLCDTEILGMLWKNLSEIGIPMVLLTSENDSDLPLAEYCQQNSMNFFRGPLDNVAQRFANYLHQNPFEYFIRISADSPLLDPEVVNQAIKLCQEEAYDLVTNVLKRTYPKGQSVELVKTKTFLSLQSEMTTPEQREHVTKIFYETPDAFNIRNFESGGQFGHIQLSVDTPEDLNIIEKMLLKNQCKKASWNHWVELYHSTQHD